MLKGTIKAGERLSLAQIASDLDVSVTPIREALTQLTETGLVTYKSNRGFFVTELSEQEATEIYEIINLLESEAIRNTYYSAEHIRQLREINKQFSACKDVKDKLHLDKTFHQKLIEKYTNQYALKIVEDIRVRVFIYELEFMNAVPTSESALMHEKIIDFLEAGNTTAAILELGANWKLSVNYIINLYQSKTL